MADHDACPFCGCVPVEDALPVWAEFFREEQKRRLPRMEHRILMMTMDQRASVYEWLAGVLRRPPLVSVPQSIDPFDPWIPLYLFLVCLQQDLGDVISDPASPVVAGWRIPFPHPRVIAADAGEVTVIVAPGESRTHRVDGYGIELPAQGAG